MPKRFITVSRSFALGLLLVSAFAVVATLQSPSASADHEHRTDTFRGVKVNAGTVQHGKENGLHVLTLSSDFVKPDAPDPHWQVVDSKGNVYLLQRLDIKGDKLNTKIVLPKYVRDVETVQIWCAWAEALLGEASFADSVR